jgi:nanoRNase/pAp phosphatase (c-di-AMP/oligoRNAs hydrolase)
MLLDLHTRQISELPLSPRLPLTVMAVDDNPANLKLIGALLDQMVLVDEGRLAILQMDDTMLEACGCTNNDTEGIINLPLTAREIQAVVFFKTSDADGVRVSMRSKYDVDVRMVASEFGGGGHKNAAGFMVPGRLGEVQDRVVQRLTRAVDEGLRTRPIG